MMEKMKIRAVAFGGLLVPVIVIASCDAPELDTRTYRLQHLMPHEAAPLIEPYVFAHREGRPGAMSSIEGALTVRETHDNLIRIEQVLAEFDRPRQDVRLRFQLIEADGFSGSDPRIEDVENELRGLFQFQGYRLAAEAILSVSDGSQIAQQLRAPDALYHISGRVYRMAQEGTRLESIELVAERYGQVLQTTASIRVGQTLVLGSAPKDESTATLFLTVRAEAVEGDGGGGDT